MTQKSEATPVLYVDDALTVEDGLASAFERRDRSFEVVGARTVREGTTVADERAIECVVAVHDLPDGTGIDLLESVRATDGELPVVLTVEESSEDLAVAAISAGVTEYLRRSGEPNYDRLAETVEAVVSSTRSQQGRDRTDQYVRELASATNDVVWMVTPEWDEVLFVNSRYRDVWGQEVGELYERPTAFFEAIHPDDRARARDATDRLAGGEAAEIEIRVNPTESFGRAVRIQAEPILADDGSVVRIVGFSRDVTDRKRRETELERIRDYFAEAERLGDLGAWELDANDELHWTAGTRRLHGVDETYEPTVAKAIAFYHEDDRDRVREAIEETRETGEPYDIQARLCLADGETRWVRTRGTTIVEDGERVGLRGFIQDVTAQREREAALRQAKAQLENALEAGAVGTWEWDIRNDRMVAGPEFARTFGVDPEVARQGAPLDRYVDAIHEADRERVVRKIEAAVEAGGEYEEEYRLRDADGNTRWLAVRGHVETDESGQPVRFPGVAVDITAQKRSERDS